MNYKDTKNQCIYICIVRNLIKNPKTTQKLKTNTKTIQKLKTHTKTIQNYRRKPKNPQKSKTEPIKIYKNQKSKKNTQRTPNYLKEKRTDDVQIQNPVNTLQVLVKFESWQLIA